jgi:hypothetical protein
VPLCEIISNSSLAESVISAIKYCTKHDILKEYLERRGAEMVDLLYEEWNLADAIAVAREERDEEVARKALAKGLPLDVIHEITGLDMDVIKSLQIP